MVLLYSGLLALVLVSYQSYGLRAHAGFQVAHLLPLLLGGLLLGRAALWWGLGILLIALMIGAGVDLSGGAQLDGSTSEVRAGLMASALTLLVATVMLDRLISASRRALRRSEELAEANARLAREMEERERAQAQLLHAQKLDAVGRMARGIAHDFNNLLGVIVGYAGIARTRDGYGGKPIEGIENAARRGALLTRRLLGLGRSRPRQIEIFDATQAASQAMALFDPLFRDRCAMTFALPERPAWVALDRSEFELALLNLATNARDAMPEGGVFSLSLEIEGGNARLAVRDTGSGMTPEVVARMFEPFFTTKPGDRGSGVGMAIVQQLVADSGGQIEVESAPDCGTTITLHLPLATPPAAFGVGEVVARIVLVEDDPDLRAILDDTLTIEGFEVTAASTATQARALPADPAPVALVLDYRLPDSDGDVLMRELVLRWPDAARLFITSHFPGDAGATAIEGVGALLKPFPPAQLVARLHSLLAESLDSIRT